jgi:alpha-D-xyloside xylohydrolase
MTTRLPWDYGEEALRIFRDYVRLRYRLLPYIYT